jgi:hypothetical protein
MRTREGHGTEVEPGSGTPGNPAEQRRGALVVVVVLVVAAVAAVSAALALNRGAGDGDVVARADPPAAAPAAPAPLEVSVDAPVSVVAGERTEMTVAWTDGTGVFSGSSEEWGDAVATSSRKQGRCVVGVAPAPPASGTYTLRHTWTDPGTYEVVLRVATYTCEDGTAVEEEAGRTLTVEVAPAT